MNISNKDDIIDSRDVIARIAEIEDENGLAPALDDPDRNEYDTLVALRDEAASYALDWEYGEALIRDSYFTEYAEQLADDIGAIDRNAGWPLCCIDWDAAAEMLKQDYTCVDFDGVDYWIRG